MEVPWQSRRASEPNQAPVGGIFRLRAGESSHVLLLDEPVGIDLHWTDDGSFPCLEGCRHCPQRVYRRWYAPAMVPWPALKGRQGWERWGQGIAELSDANLDQLEDRPFRGLYVRLGRGKEARSPQQVQVAEQQPAGEPPPGFDVIPRLYAVWGLPRHSAQEAPAPKILPLRRLA